MIDRLHNNPPDPIDTATAPFANSIAEAEGWLDGAPVENEGQMRAVDALIKDVKAAKKAVSDAEESEAKPIYDQWKAVKARYRPTLDDLDRIVKGLVAAVDGCKRRLAAEKAEAERKARAEAQAKAEAAHRAAMAARESDIEAQRAAAQAQAEAEAAQRAAAAATKANDVKGLRTVTRYEITDHRALLHWIATNRREELTEFIEGWAKRNHAATNADGLRVWKEKVAY